MKCFNHEDRDAVASCVTCGKGLCKECASILNVPQCMDCFKNDLASEKTQLIKTIGISIALFVIGFIYNGNILYAFYIACVPYGWKVLNKITPNIFLWMSWFGWLVYLLTKLVLAIIIGIFALPYTIIRAVMRLKKVSEIEKMVA